VSAAEGLRLDHRFRRGEKLNTHRIVDESDIWRFAMNILKAIVIAGTALAVSGPALAGRDQIQIMQQERAVKQMRAQQGLAGPVGAQGMIGPGTKSSPRAWNIGHPTERVRR
jgi:hypothetical protein